MKTTCLPLPTPETPSYTSGFDISWVHNEPMWMKDRIMSSIDFIKVTGLGLILIIKNDALPSDVDAGLEKVGISRNQNFP